MPKANKAGFFESVGNTIRAPFQGLNNRLEQPPKKKKSPAAGADKPTTYYDEEGKAHRGVKAGTGGTYIGRKRRRERLPKIQKEAETKKRMQKLSNIFKK